MNSSDLRLDLERVVLDVLLVDLSIPLMQGLLIAPQHRIIPTRIIASVHFPTFSSLSLFYCLFEHLIAGFISNLKYRSIHRDRAQKRENSYKKFNYLPICHA